MATGRVRQIVAGTLGGQHCVIVFTRAHRPADERVYALEMTRLLTEIVKELAKEQQTPLDEAAVVDEAERILAGGQE